MKKLFALAVLLSASVLAWSDTLPSPSSVELGFSPGDAVNVVLKAIDSAKVSLKMACYEFTSREIAEALVQAVGRGVKVQIVMDLKASRDRSARDALRILSGGKVDLRLNGQYSIMHNKFMVIDEQCVETGSFNYTEAATKRNAENAVVLWNAPEIAKAYSREWGRLWDEAR